MKYSISPDRSKLIITADDLERKEILEKDFRSDQALYESFEKLVCNSELQWTNSEDTGDLTEAPMLCIKNDNDEIVERWAFMDYMMRSPLEDLILKGKVILVGGSLS